MAEKPEEAESHNPLFTFIKSMAQTAAQDPSSIIAVTGVNTCQLVAQVEAKALDEQNQARTSGFSFSQFFVFFILSPSALLFLSQFCSASTLPDIRSNVVLSKPNN
jgi:hypothetical protein